MIRIVRNAVILDIARLPWIGRFSGDDRLHASARFDKAMTLNVIVCGVP